MHRITTAFVVCCSLVCVLASVAYSQRPPAHVESLLASAQQAQTRRDFNAAAEFYRQAVALQPESAELRSNLGLMYYQTGKDEQAIEAFQQAIHLKPGLFVPNLFLGLGCVRLRRFGEAVTYFQRAAAIKPTEIQAQIGLGEAYSGGGKTRLAIASYSRAAQIDPRNADVWYHLGVGYLGQVEADTRTMLARYKDSVYLQALVADALGEQGAFIQADKTYKKVLSSQTSPPDTHASHGFILLNLHDSHSAESEFNAELALTPGSLMAKLGLARLHLEQGNTAKSADEIESIAKTDLGFLTVHARLFRAGLSESTLAELQTELAELSNESANSEDVIALFKSAAVSAITAEALRSLAKDSASSIQTGKGKGSVAPELYGAGKYEECSNALRSHLQALPQKLIELLAACAYSTGSYETTVAAAMKLEVNNVTEAEGLYWDIRSAQNLASRALTYAGQLDSASPKLHVLLGDVYRQQGHVGEAEQEYKKALALQPHDTGAVFGLCLALLADLKTDQALQIAQTGLNQDPDDPELNAVMGEILCARHDFTEAEPYLRRGLNANPELVLHVHALFGKVYAGTNRISQAIAELKLALPGDKDGALHYQLGRLYLKTGDRAAANQAFEVSERIHSQELKRSVAAIQQSDSQTDSP